LPLTDEVHFELEVVNDGVPEDYVGVRYLVRLLPEDLEHELLVAILQTALLVVYFAHKGDQLDVGVGYARLELRQHLAGA